MVGIFETILRHRYGDPKIVVSDPFVEYRWNDGVDRLASTLYKKPDGHSELRERFDVLYPLYGDAMGGFLLRNVLKVSMLEGPKVFGLYQIEDLQDRPEVRRANSREPGICWFMDSANVWFYGIKGGELCVYDSETDELDIVGDVSPQLVELLKQWEKA